MAKLGFLPGEMKVYCAEIEVYANYELPSTIKKRCWQICIETASDWKLSLESTA